ncbi:hypothetical protein [Vaginella massiliensis]|uniref:hypothetical protein n=1 Tax=Vaginella massiliensis TaxID=1816680 RepID=UPI0008387367|nr:hypothetical protein [Vaginella massiliensis]
MNKLFILAMSFTLSLFSCEKSKVLNANSKTNKQPIDMLYNPSNINASEEQGIKDAQADFANGNYVKIRMGMPRDRMYALTLQKMQQLLEKEQISLLYGDDIMTAYKSGYIRTMDELLDTKFSKSFFEEVQHKAEQEAAEEIDQRYKKFKKENPTANLSKEEFINQLEF